MKTIVLDNQLLISVCHADLLIVYSLIYFNSQKISRIAGFIRISFLPSAFVSFYLLLQGISATAYINFENKSAYLSPERE
jgi:hypothetical protein